MQMHKDRTGRSENMTKVRQGKIAEQNEPDWEECYTCDGEGVSREHCNDGCDRGAVIQWDECEHCVGGGNPIESLGGPVSLRDRGTFVTCGECGGIGSTPRLGYCGCDHGWISGTCQSCEGQGAICHTCKETPCECPR